AVQGVFVDDAGGGLRFVPSPEPTDLEVAKLLATISRRITRLFKRHGIELDCPSEEVECLDPLASESPLLAGICGASVLGPGGAPPGGGPAAWPRGPAPPGARSGLRRAPGSFPCLPPPCHGGCPRGRPPPPRAPLPLRASAPGGPGCAEAHRRREDPPYHDAA